MDAKEALQKEIDDLEEQIKARKRALRELNALEVKRGVLAGRFSDMRPLAAIKILLTENGGSMPVAELTEALISHGLTRGKKRAHHNIRVSLQISEKNGSLLVKDGIVRLPS